VRLRDSANIAKQQNKRSTKTETNAIFIDCFIGLAPAYLIDQSVLGSWVVAPFILVRRGFGLSHLQKVHTLS